MVNNGITPAMPGPMLSIANADMKSGKNMEAMGSEFESVFLSMMIKEMRQTLETGFFGEEGSDSFGGMFDLFIGKHLAETSPLGIGELMLQQYQKHQSNGGDSSSAGLDQQPNDQPTGDPSAPAPVTQRV